MANPLELTYYVRTGYNLSDEPASDAVIELNEHWTAPLRLKEYDPGNLQIIRTNLTDDDLRCVDYLKIRDTVTNERWYYFIIGHQRINSNVAALRVALDAFATVGLSNISFFGNVARRSLSAAERANYPLLPEPWAPRRPLKTRRIIIDLNVNKTIKMPSHISIEFSEKETLIEKTETIQIPNSPLGISSSPDSLSVSASIPIGFPNIAGDTTHIVTTPWGTISYITPYEEYYTLSGTVLETYLARAKMYNSLDLIEPPYYVPNPGTEQVITLPELSNSSVRNPKASRYYTAITIRSLASNSARTYSDNDTKLSYNQSLTVIIAPDKSGGIYIMPTTIRDTGLSAYTYLDGVYSPFETVLYNAAGDTPGKFASDGTMLLNTALNKLFQTYTNKVNALQVESMQAKYYKELGSLKNLVIPFAAEVLGSVSTSVTEVGGYWQNTNTTTNTPMTKQTSNQTQEVPQHTQTQSQTTTIHNYTYNQNTTSNIPNVIGSQSSSTTTNEAKQTQNSYNYVTNSNSGSTNIPSIVTVMHEHKGSSTTNTTQNGYNTNSITYINTPTVTHNLSGSISTPLHFLKSNTNTTTNGYDQTSRSSTFIDPQTHTSKIIQEPAKRSVKDGNEMAVEGIPTVFELEEYGTNAWGTLKNLTFGGYRNEMHSLMLGNINEYLNRWVSIQNDMHNGEVANLFKNVTLVGNYNSYNKLVGKYEILVTSLQPEDEVNFDLFLDHFGHAVDEYTNTLVSDVRTNYNYTMVGEDAILANSVLQSATPQILAQFRTGVRVWKTLIRPENY